MAGTRKEAEKAFDVFIEMYEAKHEAAVACLKKDRDAPLTFYDFPAQHWTHLRTTNPIESTCATVRLRHDKTKGNGSKKACLTMVFKLAEAARNSWGSSTVTPCSERVGRFARIIGQWNLPMYRKC